METLYQTRLYQNYRSVLIVVIDLLIVFASYVFTFFMDNNFFLDGKILHITHLILYGMLFLLLLHLVVGLVFSTQKALWTYTGPQDIVRTGLSSLTCTVIMLIFTQTMHLFHPSLIIISEVIAFLLKLGVRLGYRYLHQYLLNVDRSEKALVIGAGNGGYIMVNEIYRGSRYPYNVVGYLDDFKPKGTLVGGKKVLGTTEEVKEIVEKYDVKNIFIAISKIDKENKQRIIEQCAETPCITKIMRFSLENDKEPIRVDEIQIEDLLNRHTVDLKNEEIGMYLSDQVVCVTGAGGSIGSELCRQIVQFQPKKLIMIDINENTLYMLKQEFMRKMRNGSISPNIELVSLIISIREREEMFKFMEQYHPDVLFHAAAHKHVPLMEDRPMEAIRNNVFGTKNVIDACIQGGVKRLIMISTDKAVNPTNVMGATKRMTELILQSREHSGEIKMAAVRFGNVLGSDGSVIPIFKEQIKQGGPVTVTDYNIQRYFMTIPEAAQLVLQAGYYASQQEIFVLDMGKPVKILDLAEKMIRLSGFKPYEEIAIQEIGLRPGEKMFEELALEIEQCHRTDNKLIFVHDRLEIPQQEIDQKLEVLKKTIENTDDIATIKSVLLDLIKDDPAYRNQKNR
ncbi:polysaccharide biosynthesis protein [Dubosiella newyorkensis]|uniref:polysaccharide biosynthesis protein n=3 Tax=Dubosiella newyorkensis TaxID=1862672 RepID=UPI002352970E|nr:nucleoside-diphosphate sugar epimerase/dehydratase [Dubosiella newyorkensis]